MDDPGELWDILDRLSERQRTAVVLRYYADLPESEIAAILHCRPSTVRSLVQRALTRLREELST
jgi:RNA polymerase sigma factor (sigma-70 family)